MSPRLREIVRYVSANPDSRRNEIANALGLGAVSVGVYLAQAKGEGLLIATEKGAYSAAPLIQAEMLPRVCSVWQLADLVTAA